MVGVGAPGGVSDPWAKEESGMLTADSSRITIRLMVSFYWRLANGLLAVLAD